ncbi:MAG: excinuclease ABC subunit UvrA [Trueperaceae bacterium]|nr:MAG: excinuclease ABC subunit UvrA [Trueperaceae bacterium]
MANTHLTVRGAKHHNLKNLDVAIPRDALVVITGVSGSGKSSLAFDTIYAEGQRRYVESLSSYARQFLGQMEKPKVDHISGLSPAIAIEQKTVSKNPRSTVGTVTEVMDYLRVLYANIGRPHCPSCSRDVTPQSAEQITQQLASLEPGTRFQLLAPVVRNRKGTHAEVLAAAKADGFARARIDGHVTSLNDDLHLDKKQKHSIEIVVDRLSIPEQTDERFLSRLTDSVETTLRTTRGLLIADLGDRELLMSEHNACPHCQISFPELSTQMFSFNSPLGMCETCHGLGTQLTVDPNLIIDDPNISINDGALRWYGPAGKKEGWSVSALRSVARHYEVDLDTPWKELPTPFRNALLHGSGREKILFRHRSKDGSFSGESRRKLYGIVYNIRRRYKQTRSEAMRRYYQSFMSEQPCPACRGARLRPEARAVTVGGKNLPGVSNLSIREAHQWVAELERTLDEQRLEIAGEVLKEIHERLQFMLNVGLHYLTLDRKAGTLSGGEGQRIRLASQIGSGLMGVLYILDEPSIGLHARDNSALIETLTRLRELGNTVLVVEHDSETMWNADWIVDLGPGAGIKGGELVAEGPPAELASSPTSLTGLYLSGRLGITSPNPQRRKTDSWIELRGASLNNLKEIDARLPLQVLTCVTGVSGSGKSSLVTGTLYPALARRLNGAKLTPGEHETLLGLERIDKVIHITQDPIGRTPRSNPATYAGVFDEIRNVFTLTPEARKRGYAAGRFSFNVKGGRCEACGGHGQNRIEMHFLADVWVSCKECGGKRYNRETLTVTYQGKSIADILEMDVQEALEFFEAHPKITRILTTLHDVGLDYIKLGQSATTFSGGEAQRIKLAKELGKRHTGNTLYILDEPTTGLHIADTQRLLDVLHRLVDAGNTVVVIEHNMDVIKTADWIIDLGPEGGDDGGSIIAEGTPETIAQVDESYTGTYLAKVIDNVPGKLGWQKSEAA